MKAKLFWMETVAVAILAAAAMGQSMRTDQVAHVPFPFVVSNQTLPPGTYVLTKVGETRLRIRGSAGQGVLVQTHKVQGHAPEGSGKLVFHRYSNVYFLSEVWSPAQDIGQQLSRSHGELKMKNTEAEVETAELRFPK